MGSLQRHRRRRLFALLRLPCCCLLPVHPSSSSKHAAGISPGQRMQEAGGHRGCRGPSPAQPGAKPSRRFNLHSSLGVTFAVSHAHPPRSESAEGGEPLAWRGNALCEHPCCGCLQSSRSRIGHGSAIRKKRSLPGIPETPLKTPGATADGSPKPRCVLRPLTRSSQR